MKNKNQEARSQKSEGRTTRYHRTMLCRSKLNKFFWLLSSGVCLLFSAGCEPMFDEPAEYESFRESRPLGNVKEMSLDLDYGVGKLEIGKTQPGELFTLELEYDRRRYVPKFDFDESGGRASLDFELDRTRPGFFGDSDGDNELTLKLNDATPLEIDLSVGVAESHLDFSDLDITRMRLRGGVSRTEVSFDRLASRAMSLMEVESGVGDFTVRGLGNARVEQLELKGGVGRTVLDFTGDWGDWSTRTSVTVGVGHVRLVIPREVPVEIRAEGSFLSNISAPSFERDRNRYTHNLSGGAEPKIEIRVKSGVGSVTVELV